MRNLFLKGWGLPQVPRDRFLSPTCLITRTRTPPAGTSFPPASCWLWRRNREAAEPAAPPSHLLFLQAAAGGCSPTGGCVQTV